MRMNFLAVGLYIEISVYRTLIVLSYMKLHNAWLLKTSSKKKKVTMGLDNTAKAMDHVKIKSIVTISCVLGPTGYH